MESCTHPAAVENKHLCGTLKDERAFYQMLDEADWVRGLAKGGEKAKVFKYALSQIIRTPQYITAWRTLAVSMIQRPSRNLFMR